MRKYSVLLVLAMLPLIFITACKMKGITSTFTDHRNGQSYKMIRIGSQVWMAENLNWVPANEYGGWSGFYDDNADNCTIYGRLYTWHSAMQGASSSSANPSNVQGVCPPGWHLPSDAEWTQLTNWLGTNGHSGSVGTALKATSANSTPWDGTDNYGFSALPAGWGYGGSFSDLGSSGGWWTATEYISTGARVRGLASGTHRFSHGSNSKALYLSVRCVRD